MLTPAYWLIALDWCIRIGFSLRVITRRRSVGISLAWLTIILLIPLVGAVIYLLLGETRLGNRRAIWASHLREYNQRWLNQLSQYVYDCWSSRRNDPSQLAQLITAACGIPPLSGNRLQLIGTADEIFSRMIADIDSARHSCWLEYYIWEAGGLADELAAAVGSAAERGVDCRILVDAVGSRGFLRSAQAKALRQQGVQIRAALPVGLFRALFYRFDLRLHRKIAVVDRRVAHVGSQNMADPKIFQRGAGFGQWIDASIRIEGPAVECLLLTFWEDWQLESAGHPADPPDHRSLDALPQPGEVPLQVIPSGPGVRSDAIRQILLNAIYMADHHLIITTPYFVPDDALQMALLSAARRGVNVSLIVPHRINSRLVRLATRPYLRELVGAGVQVAQYQGGMLHTKSISIDGDTCIFGSLNLDPRSFHLNFEITLAIYEAPFSRQLENLQRSYLQQAHVVSAAELTSPHLIVRFLESCARLLAPLL